MRRFAFVAAGPDGRIVRGFLSAEGELRAGALVEERGLIVVKLREARRPLLSRPAAGRRDLAIALGSMAGLVETGLSVDAALRTTAALVSRRLGAAFEAARGQLAAGLALSDALERVGAGLPPAALGVLRAGENGSQLERGLREAAGMLDREAEIAARVSQAMAYPALLTVTGSAALVLILGTVIPRFATLLADLGQATPPTTRALLALSDLIRSHAAALFGGACMVALALTLWLRTESGREMVDRASLRLPILGPVVRLLATGRLAGAFGAMVSAGVPLIPALRGAAGAGANRDLARRINRAATRTSQGEELHRALEAEAALTPETVRLIAIGESNGRLGPMAVRAAELARGEAERRIRIVTTLLEPALILCFAAVVGFVALALLQALYSLRPAGM